MTSERTTRLMLVIHYDGSRFFGWQIQPERRTVQGVLHAAAEMLTDGPVTVTGSGRTDRGVHATGQVASLEVPDSWDGPSFRKSMNAVLPDDIWIEEARRVGGSFHPRYDAVGRTYRYRLGTVEEASSPFHRPFCWNLDEAVDRSLLDEAAGLVPGDRSFEAFAKSGQPERGTRCHVTASAWSSWDELGLAYTVTADRFLHHMVRYLVGTMVAVASGRRPLDEMSRLLAEGPSDQHWTSAPAPARGLYLHRVEYPEAALALDESISPHAADDVAGEAHETEHPFEETDRMARRADA